LSDAVTSIRGWLIAASLRAEVGMPSVIAGANRCGECPAMRIRSGQPAEIGAFAHANAGDKKGHRVLLGGALRRRLLCGCQVRTQKCSRSENKNDKWGPRHTGYLRLLLEGRTAHPYPPELTSIVKLLRPFARPNE
jgi:hypothetical protein